MLSSTLANKYKLLLATSRCGCSAYWEVMYGRACASRHEFQYNLSVISKTFDNLMFNETERNGLKWAGGGG